MGAHVAEADSDPVRASSVGPVSGQQRASTGVRAYIFTYLWHISKRDESAFNTAIQQLCEANRVVLHLCGCGLPVGGINGCTEPTHLRLGTDAENREHTHQHAVLRRMTGQNYPVVKAAINQDCMPDGGGIF